MTTAAASWLQSHDFAEISFVLLFEGLDLAYCTSNDVSALATAWSTASGGKWTNIKGGLQISGSISQEIRVFNAQINPSNLSFTLHDIDDTLIGYLEAENRSSTNKVQLGASVNSNYGLISSATDNSSFASSGEIYVGTETIVGIKGTNAWLGRRGYRALYGTWSTGDFGQPHLVDSQTGDAPWITDRPQNWLNRSVGLYVCHKVNGVWSAGLPGSNINDAELLWTGRITNYEDEGDGKIVLNCIDVMDRLKTSLFTQQYTGTLQEGLFILDTDTEIGTRIDLVDQATSVDTFYPLSWSTWTASGQYLTHDAVASAINQKLNDRFVVNAGTYAPAGVNAAFIRGQDGKYSLQLNYTPADGNTYGFGIALSPRIWYLLGFVNLSAQGTIQSGTTINSNDVMLWVADTTQSGSYTVVADELPFRTIANLDPGNNSTNSNGSSIVQVTVSDVANSFIAQPSVPNYWSIPKDATGFLMFGGKRIFAVSQGTAANTFNLLQDVTQLLGPDDGSGPTISDIAGAHDSGSGGTTAVAQVWIQTAPIGQMFLQLLASTGTSGYNHPNYDVMPQSMCVGVPWGILDTDSILAMGTDPYLLFLTKADSFLKLFESALNFSARNCVWKNGKITVVSPGEGAQGSANLVALTEATKAKNISNGNAETAVLERTVCARNPDGIINRVTIKYNQSIGGSFLKTVTVSSVSSQTDASQVKSLSLDAYGIYDGVSLIPVEGIIRTWTDRVAAVALSYYGKPLAVAKRSFDFSLATQLYCGTQVSVTDNALVDPSTGTRGVTNLMAWVQAVEFDWTSGVGTVQFVFQPARAASSGVAASAMYGPSATVDWSYNLNSFTGGYKSSTKELRLRKDDYCASGSTDISFFAVGDKVHVIELSPSVPGSPQGWQDTIASIDANNLQVTLTTGLASFSSSKKYVLEYDTISNVVTAQRQKSFIADETTRSTGRAANDAYLWGADPATAVPETFIFTQPYRKINTTSDDQGTPLSVHKVHDLSRWANTAVVHHMAPIYVNQPLTQAVTYSGGGSSRRIVFGPVKIPLYYGSDRELEFKLLAANTAANGVNVSFRAITTSQLPKSGGNSNFDDPVYFDVRSATQNLNWISLSTNSSSYDWLRGLIPVPTTAGGGRPPLTWFMVDASADGLGGTPGIKHVFLREYPGTLALPDVDDLGWLPQVHMPPHLMWRKSPVSYFDFRAAPGGHLVGGGGFSVQRFYLPLSLASTPASTVDGGTSWGSTTGSTYNFLLPGKVTFTPTTSFFGQGSTISWTGSSSVTALDRRYVGPPLVGQTISGTVKSYMLAKEGAAGAHSRTRLGIHVVSGDGSTLRGTLLTIGEYGVAADLNTSNRNKSFASSGTALSSLAVQSGDRLVVDYGYSDSSGTTPSASALYGASASPGTDLAENETATATANPWIEFSNPIQLKQALPQHLTNSGILTGSFGSSPSASPTADTPQLVYVADSTSGAPPPVPNVPTLSTSTGLSFTQVGTVYMDPTGSAQKFRLTVFYAPGVSVPGTGTVTADFAGQSQAGIRIWWYQLKGCAGIAQSFFDSTVTGNPATTSFSISLPSAPAADSACMGIYVYSAGFGGTMGVTSGWDWIDQSTYVTTWRPNGGQTCQVSNTLSSNKWCAAILELTAS